jgi:hypothetical protein
MVSREHNKIHLFTLFVNPTLYKAKKTSLLRTERSFQAGIERDLYGICANFSQS